MLFISCIIQLILQPFCGSGISSDSFLLFQTKVQKKSSSKSIEVFVYYFSFESINWQRNDIKYNLVLLATIFRNFEFELCERRELRPHQLIIQCRWLYDCPHRDTETCARTRTHTRVNRWITPGNSLQKQFTNRDITGNESLICICPFASVYVCSSVFVCVYVCLLLNLSLLTIPLPW